MAKKRMFSQTITNSSRFLMMPSSTQTLYFHLGMNADDDGFCEHFTIMRMTGSKPDDLKILQSKNFVRVFDEKVLIIMDWKENNYIRNDRYSPSKYLKIYKNELAQLSSGIPNGIPMVDKRLTQIRLDKIRLDKNNTIATKVAKKFSFNDYLEEMKKSKDTRMPIIALYAKSKGVLWENAEQARSFIKRNLRYATLLKGYKLDKIKEVIGHLSKNADYKWTLETIAKFIDEPNLDKYDKRDEAEKLKDKYPDIIIK